MSTIYINTRQSEERRIVIVKGGVLVGFEQDIAGWENKKGDIYKAVVTHIEEGLDAAFVNFGEAKNGFLPLKYVAPDLPGASGGKNKLAEGDSILVQIKKDHVSDKGAGMTTNISLAGCYLVLMPNTPKDKAMMSKSTGGRERQKTAAMLSELNVPDGMGVIVRTAGINRPAEDLRWDLESYLLKLWRAVEEAARNHRGPVLIYRENNLMMRAVRDYYKPGEDQIYCDDADSYHELKNFMELVSPDHADCVHYYEGEGVMVPDTVERQIDSIYQREIKTPSGARVVFDSTEAMVTVDVNSAQVRGHSDIDETALQVNIEAADVIARHLRLRDLGGLVVVDFIDMTAEKKRQKLEEYFSGLLRRDRARVQWTALSRFGLMELSRQRLSRPVAESQSVMCQTCHGTGRQGRPEAFALRLLRHIRQQLDGETGALVVQAPADAAIYLLNEKRVELRRLEDEGDCEILIVPSQILYPPDFSIRKIKSESRVGVSYQVRPPEKDYAETVQQRIKKRNKPQAKAVIENIMPEERPEKEENGGVGGFLSALKKRFFGDGKKPQLAAKSDSANKKTPARGGRPSGNNTQRQHARNRRGGRRYHNKREDGNKAPATARASGGNSNGGNPGGKATGNSNNNAGGNHARGEAKKAPPNHPPKEMKNPKAPAPRDNSREEAKKSPPVAAKSAGGNHSEKPPKEAKKVEKAESAIPATPAKSAAPPAPPAWKKSAPVMRQVETKSSSLPAAKSGASDPKNIIPPPAL